MEMTLRQRLLKVVTLIESQADKDWDNAQKHDQSIHYHLIGWSSGGRNTVKLLKAEFPEFFRGDEDVQPPGDDPVEPVVYIDQNNVLFRDAYDRFYFWDSDYINWHGPYGKNVDACREMRKYAADVYGGKEESDDDTYV